MTCAVAYRMAWSRDASHKANDLVSYEWLLTNGLGGYASSTIAGACTRRYHGLLVAALPAPMGRMMMFNHVVEQLQLPGGRMVPIGGDPHGSVDESDTPPLANFSLDFGLPVWRYEVAAAYLVERRIVMPHGANTVHLMYRLLSGQGRIGLRLQPGLHFRALEGAATAERFQPYALTVSADRVEIAAADTPPLRMLLRGQGGAMILDGRFYDVEYAVERERGYADHDVLWSPGHFWAELSEGDSVTLSASTEPWDTLLSVEPGDELTAQIDRRRRLIDQADPRARCTVAAELVLAADQFIITPITRVGSEATSRRSSDGPRSVIAGYHWFTDWGRDTMISLEGLTLTTGRQQEAGCILRTFARHVRDGLIPNLFPEGQTAGVYHTADATLWYFHALDRYLQATPDRATLRALLPTLRGIVDHHLKGTRFGIGVDPADGLLRQGQEGYQLTWMDAKVGDWVVTPRRGKAVEINALWYNALRLLARWLTEEGRESEARDVSCHADRAHQSFNRRFWIADRGWLYDVVDGEGPDDASLRPNQILAISLRNPVLDKAHWSAVVETVKTRLLTPVGLRSLAPGEPNYKPHYGGDLRTRDAAYHQGTVWAWLLGPFIDAWLKVYPDRVAEARGFLSAFGDHLNRACIGSISEIFDAEQPHSPCGCVAQAWSVAEVLRAWVLTTPESATA